MFKETKKTWLDNLAVDNYSGANKVYTCSFYLQGWTEYKQASADEFFDAALQWFGYRGDPLPSAHNKGLQLAELINQQRTLLVLDGLEPLQYPEGGAMDGALRAEGLRALFKQLAAQNGGLLLISLRQKSLSYTISLSHFLFSMSWNRFALPQESNYSKRRISQELTRNL